MFLWYYVLEIQCIFYLHLQHISVWTSHISGAQYTQRGWPLWSVQVGDRVRPYDETIPVNIKQAGSLKFQLTC